MATTIKTPKSMRPAAPSRRPVPTELTSGETLEVMPQKPATMRPETLSQVPKELGWSRPETTQRGGPRRLPVPTELKRKSKIKAKPKP